jgi:uroporphyrinogen-III synthase
MGTGSNPGNPGDPPDQGDPGPLPAATGPLAGALVALAEARELDLFAGLLERRGARVLRAPLVAILDAADPAPVLAWLRVFAAGGCDDLVLLTGEGLRRLLGCIERHEPSLREPFLSALRRVRRVTRGPKPARALRQLGMAPDLEAAVPTTDGVIRCLAGLALADRRVGVQLYGEEPNAPLVEFLRSRRAVPLCVAPYRYAAASEDASVQALLGRLAGDEVAAIAFTSAAQVRRLFAAGLPAGEVRAALAHAQVAAVGPVVAEEIRRHGVAVDAMPGSSWSMKPLATELVRLLAAGLPSAPGADAGNAQE